MTFTKQMIAVEPVIDFPGLERILKSTGGTAVSKDNGYVIDTPEIRLGLARETFQKEDILELYFKEQDITFGFSFKPSANLPPTLECTYFKAEGKMETKDPSGFSPYYEQFTNGSMLLSQAVKKYDLKDLYQKMSE